MPRENITWDNINASGNPSKSVDVNELIAKIKKHEVRKEGAASQAVRALEYDEFVNVLMVLRTSERIPLEEKYRIASILTIQWHLIARIDDVMKLQLQNIQYNPSNNYTLNAQLSWSKNIMEERVSPVQILLASMDDRICVFLNLAIYLETNSKNTNPRQSEFLYDNGKDGIEL